MLDFYSEFEYIILKLRGETMKTIRFGLVLIVLALSSCSVLYPPIEDKDIPVSHSFTSIDDAWKYVAWEIHFAYDDDVWGQQDFWQTPSETYELKTGDCEDKSILFMHLLDRMGYNPRIVFIGNSSTVANHAIVELNGIYYEPQIYHSYLKKSSITIVATYSYKGVLDVMPTYR